VGDTPAKIGAPTLLSSRSYGYFTRVVVVADATIPSPQVVLSRSPFKLSERYIALTVFSIVYITLCAKNTARIRIQYIVPLPDISPTLRKQFLAGYYHSDAFTGFHYLVSSTDILRGFNYWFSFRQLFEIPTSQVKPRCMIL